MTLFKYKPLSSQIEEKYWVQRRGSDASAAKPSLSPVALIGVEHPEATSPVTTDGFKLAPIREPVVPPGEVGVGETAFAEEEECIANKESRVHPPSLCPSVHIEHWPD
jgi:hypothetical protein